jgi:hypothetical protein
VLFSVVIVVGFKTRAGYGLGRCGYGYGLHFVNPLCTHTHHTGRWVYRGFFGGFALNGNFTESAQQDLMDIIYCTVPIL